MPDADQLELIQKVYYNFFLPKYYNRFTSDVNHYWLYRGQADKEFDLVSSLYRDSSLKNESQIIKDHPSYESLPNKPLLRKLAYIQHYSGGTRLLDITTDPNIALFFACYDNKHSDADGKVFIFDMPQHEIFKDKEIDIISILYELSNDEQIELLKASLFYIDQPELNWNDCRFSALEKFRNLLLMNKLPTNFEPMILLSTYAVLPEYEDNVRLCRQHGGFVVSGLCFNAKDNSYKNRKTLISTTDDIIIDGASKFSILNELKNIEISEDILLPADLDYPERFMVFR